MNLTHFYVIHWVHVHPDWTELIIFLLSLTESLAVIGTFIPGTTAMFFAGALIGAGVLDPGLTFTCAIAGAVAGDGASFWIGHRYKEQVVNMWPFRVHRELLEKGQGFVARHGGKSILFARFAGPIRAIVPVVVGMFGISPLRFYTVNILSALAWSIVHILPGIVFGASLQLAGEISIRLVILVILLAAFFWFGFWLVRTLLSGLLPWIGRVRSRALAWAGQHNNLPAGMLIRILSPEEPESGVLLLMAALLLLGTWVFLGVVQDLLSKDPLIRVDVNVEHVLQGLRIPWMDGIMVGVSALGSVYVLIPVVVVVALWLGFQRQWRTFYYWLAAAGFSQGIILLIKEMLGRERPINWYTGWEQYSFPSGHATNSAVIYGFLVFLIARQSSSLMRRILVTVTAMLVFLIAFSRLYLGAHWLSDVIGGVSLGLAWVAMLSLAYTYHHPPRLPTKNLLGVTLVTMLLASGGQWFYRIGEGVGHHGMQSVPEIMGFSAWQQGGWQALPAYRVDFASEPEEPFTLQWAGSRRSITRELVMAGWKPPPGASWAHRFLVWLIPQVPAMNLPVLPRLNGGVMPAIQFIHASTQPDRREVLRLWPSGYVISFDGLHREPLWLGEVSCEKMSRLLSMMTLIRTEKGADRCSALSGRLFPGEVSVQRINDPSPLLLIGTAPV